MNEDGKGADPIIPPKPAEGVGEPQTLTKEDVAKIVQSENDKLRTKYSQEIKAKEAEILELKKSTMTEKELRELREKDLALKEKELQRKELVIIATDSLKDSGLPTDFRDFVLAETPELTQSRVLKLKDVIQKAVESAVQEKFKTGGHEPGKATPPQPTITRGQLKTMTQEEIAKNLDLYKELMAKGQIK